MKHTARRTPCPKQIIPLFDLTAWSKSWNIVCVFAKVIAVVERAPRLARRWTESVRSLTIRNYLIRIHTIRSWFAKRYENSHKSGQSRGQKRQVEAPAEMKKNLLFQDFDLITRRNCLRSLGFYHFHIKSWCAFGLCLVWRWTKR